MTIEEIYIKSSYSEFRKYKAMADKAIAQLSPEDLIYRPDAESNSMMVIMKHLAGNMISRWTDFLTTDGEKANRNRDAEFDETVDSHEQLTSLWERGWNILFSTFEALQPSDLIKTVYIRGEAHSVIDAINRQLMHYGYHVGQMVYVAKHIRSTDWQSLSIPRGKSDEFNRQLFAKNDKP